MQRFLSVAGCVTSRYSNSPCYNQQEFIRVAHSSPRPRSPFQLEHWHCPGG